MFQCPLCELEYPDEKVPDDCTRCKRPLVVQKRFRIERSIEHDDAWGEDFDAVDLKSRENVILRELRVHKRDMADARDKIEHYKQNIVRLRGMKLYGEPVLIEAFDAEFKNSVCFYYVFTESAWAELGGALHSDDDAFDAELGRDSGGSDDLDDLGDLDDLDALISGGGGGAESDPAAAASSSPPKKAAPKKAAAADGGGEDDPGISDDDLAFLDSMLSGVDGGEGGDGGDFDYLADLEKRSGATPSSKSDKGDKGGAMVKATGDRPPARQSSGGSALSKRPVQIAVAVGGSMIIIAIIVAIMFL